MIEPNSDTTVPSSSPSRSNVPFSDTAPAGSTSPPSSPPGFAWGRADEVGKAAFSSRSSESTVDFNSDRHEITAFSLLGKRKALQPTTPNPRSTKRSRHSDSVSATAPSKPASRSSPAPSSSKPLTQLHISLGQRTRTTCAACGMQYVPSLPEDTRLHARFHSHRLAGCVISQAFIARTVEKKRWTGFQPQRSGEAGEGEVVATGQRRPLDKDGKKDLPDKDLIVRIDAEDSAPRKAKAREVLDVVQTELGAVSLGDLWDKEDNEDVRRAGYLYIRENRVVGFLLTESVREGWKVIEGKKRDEKKEAGKQKGKMSSALEALRAKKVAAKEIEGEVEKRPIELSQTKDSVELGISRIWALAACRGQGIAASMLDTAVRDQHVHDKTRVAFSQPTQAGARLARKWTGLRYGWRVYA